MTPANCVLIQQQEVTRAGLGEEATGTMGIQAAKGTVPRPIMC
jgi:hypothetical protein